MLDTILKLVIEIACGAIVLYVLLRHSDRPGTDNPADPSR
jgi:hypothetical protein